MKLNVGKKLLDNSLWFAAAGLMLSSSGIDGAYMALMMESSLWSLGYVMNSVADLTGLAIMYWYGRLQQESKGSKRWKLSKRLLGAEVVAVLYSWFFSWRQLVRVLPDVEGSDTVWVAPIAAGFVPLLLAFIGWAQAVKAGKFEDKKDVVVQLKEQKSEVVMQSKVDIPVQPTDEQHSVVELICPICSATTDKSGIPWKSKRALNAHVRWCKQKVDF